MHFKDYFSDKGSNYLQYRPDYPPQLYDFILSKTKSRKLLWDCGTGNGQMAIQLSSYFEEIYASDASAEQIKYSIDKDNITYFVCKAEDTPFDNQIFDLITVGQAIHWFDFDAFWKEVKRVLKPDGIFACWTYTLLYSDEKEIQQHLEDFFNLIDEYWPKERNYVRDKYKTIPFPDDFVEIDSPDFEIKRLLSLSQTMNYLRTWSSTKQFIKANSYDPVDEIERKLEPLWNKNSLKSITHPVYLRLFQI